jgi:hypothetical protein
VRAAATTVPDVDAELTLTRLAETATTLERLEAPAGAGVYAYFLAEGAALPTVTSPGGGPIYVGVSGNLAERGFDTHFVAGKTGFSTLRRSIGAILMEHLDLHARPRGTGASKTNFANYRFDDAGEQRLSAWMHEHLRVAVEPVSDPDDLERALIALACPPLNLKGWPNPEAATIKALRKICADQARRDHPRA